MKNLNKVINKNSEEKDILGESLFHARQIIHMVDDIYNTIGDISDIDPTLHKSLVKLSNKCNDIYSDVNNKYGITPVDYKAIASGLKTTMTESKMSQLSQDIDDEIDDKLAKKGFEVAPISSDTYKAPKLIKLWGIKMRAGKWADVFFALFEPSVPKRYSIITQEGTFAFAELKDAFRYIAGLE